MLLLRRLESPPTRGRGLKRSTRQPPNAERVASPPTRGRGLKQRAGHRVVQGAVSPPTRGRGLKLVNLAFYAVRYVVAPYTGARIETCSSRLEPPSGPSPPTRGRGLKPVSAHALRRGYVSPPTRGRGLKLPSPRNRVRPVLSPPTRGRGLKQVREVDMSGLPEVAPYTGARIETAPRWHRGTR